MRSFTLLINLIFISYGICTTEDEGCLQTRCAYKDCFWRPNITRSSCFDSMLAGRSENSCERDDQQKRIERFWKFTVS